MVLYIAIYAVLFFLALLDLNPRNKPISKVFFVTIGLGFILMSGLRWRTGADWTPYMGFFKGYRTDIPIYQILFEPGYTALTAFIKMFSSSYTTFLILFALLTIGLKLIFFQKYTNALLLALLLYWGNNMAEIASVRQALAISICLISIPSIYKRKKIASICFVLLAMQIHISSFIFLFAYPIFHAKWSTRWQYILIGLSIIIGLSGMLNSVLSFVGDLSFLGRLSEKADAYQRGGDKNVGGTAPLFDKLIGIAKRMIVLPLLIYHHSRVWKNRREYTGMLNLFIFGNMIYFIVIDFIVIQRMAAYFYPLEIVLMCMLFDRSKSKPVFYVIFATYALLKLLLIVYGAAGFIVPYYHIFMDNFPRGKDISNF